MLSPDRTQTAFTGLPCFPGSRRALLADAEGSGVETRVHARLAVGRDRGVVEHWAVFGATRPQGRGRGVGGSSCGWGWGCHARGGVSEHPVAGHRGPPLRALGPGRALVALGFVAVPGRGPSRRGSARARGGVEPRDTAQMEDAVVRRGS